MNATRAQSHSDRVAKNLKRGRMRQLKNGVSVKGRGKILTRRQDLRQIPVWDAIEHFYVPSPSLLEDEDESDPSSPLSSSLSSSSSSLSSSSDSVLSSDSACAPTTTDFSQEESKPKFVGLILHASVCSMNSSWLCGLAWAEALQSQCSMLTSLTLKVWSSFLLLDLGFYTNTEALLICKAKLESELILSKNEKQIEMFTQMFNSDEFCELVKHLKDSFYQNLTKNLLLPRSNIRIMINTLKSEGWKIAIIHFSSFLISDYELNSLHLLNLASAVVNSSCLVEKETRPYVSLYVEALSRLDLTPETCLCIATHPFQVLDASQIGLSSLLITDNFNMNMEFPFPHYRYPPLLSSHSLSNTQSARSLPGDLVSAIRCLHSQEPIPSTELVAGLSCLAMDSSDFMMSLAVVLDVSPEENGEKRKAEVRFLTTNRTALVPIYNIILLKSEVELLGIENVDRAPS